MFRSQFSGITGSIYTILLMVMKTLLVCASVKDSIYQKCIYATECHSIESAVDTALVIINFKVELIMSLLVFRSVIHSTWKQYIPPKLWYLPTVPYSIMSQKTNIDTSTTMRP